MTHSARLVDLVGERITSFLDDRASIVAGVSPDANVLIEYSKRFLSGGKRFRALFTYWGWKAISDADSAVPIDASSDHDLDPIVTVAAAFEIFHAAALVHDDIMDNSDTRRGSPSAHKLFEAQHLEGGYLGSTTGFGNSAALLLGDLLLGWSDELLDEGLASVTDRAAARMARYEFNLMRTEVTAGQYLDILEECAWNTVSEAVLRDRAERVILYKSAKYSIEAPLLIGASLAGATARDRNALSGFGRPLGLAFQLRDDLLGVYGDPSVTGKPAGDDLIEGKRTVLIAIARERLPAGPRRLLDEMLGDPHLSGEQIALLQNTIRDSGAVTEVELMIRSHVDDAKRALSSGQFAPSAQSELLKLADSVTNRSH